MAEIKYEYAIANINTGSVAHWKTFTSIEAAKEYIQERPNSDAWKVVRRKICEWEDL